MLRETHLYLVKKVR
uniref:Uncharacterized protein n=1 Tax=Anguilla anguilla TaxID=7936 RepID=A0A0E9VS49_ANGAN